MNKEEKEEKVMEEIGELDWSDDKIPEIMEGFFNKPIEAIDSVQGRMSEDHIDFLITLLNIDDENDSETD